MFLKRNFYIPFLFPTKKNVERRYKMNLKLINRILLGLVMLISGLLKLFDTGSAGVVLMLSGIALLK